MSAGGGEKRFANGLLVYVKKSPNNTIPVRANKCPVSGGNRGRVALGIAGRQTAARAPPSFLCLLPGLPSGSLALTHNADSTQNPFQFLQLPISTQGGQAAATSFSYHSRSFRVSKWPLPLSKLQHKAQSNCYQPLH